MGGNVGGAGWTLGSGSGSTGNVWADIATLAVNLIGNISFKSIRDKAKAEKALKIAQSGGYNTLTPYQKSLITYYSPDTCYATPENAGQSLDITSILIFAGILLVVIVLFFRRRN